MNSGGTPGNKGGHRPIEAVRIRSRAVYAAVLKQIENRKLDELGIDELTKIGNMAGKYGVPTQRDQGELGEADATPTADERKARILKLVKGA